MGDEVTFSALGDTQAGNGNKRGVLNGPNKFRTSFVLALVGVVLVFAGASNVLGSPCNSMRHSCASGQKGEIHSA